MKTKALILTPFFAAVLSVGTSEIASATGLGNDFFNGERFTENDAVLVIDQADNTLFSWQANKPLIPASLTKLMTAQLAIEKWGLNHRFVTDFYQTDKALWVRGYGDPFLVSEELDLVVAGLISSGFNLNISSINVDNHYFDVTEVPGRSSASDPYNAPLSAVSANFNTVNLRRLNGVVTSAETQTPLTPTALTLSKVLKAKTERVNLVNADNAQRHFAQLLMAKLSAADISRAKPAAANTTAGITAITEVAKRVVSININQRLPEHAKLIYRHRNSHTLAEVLRGALEFSNNFIANQLFLKLADQTDAANLIPQPEPVSFLRAREFVSKKMVKRDAFTSYVVSEGAGLSRQNRLSASQLDDLLKSLYTHKNLLKRIDIKSTNNSGTQTEVFAKTGTLDGVRTYAGYIALSPPAEHAELKQTRNFRFVFMFNRTVPWRYRDQMLTRLVSELRDF